MPPPSSSTRTAPGTGTGTGLAIPVSPVPCPGLAHSGHSMDGEDELDSDFTSQVRLRESPVLQLVVLGSPHQAEAFSPAQGLGGPRAAGRAHKQACGPVCGSGSWGSSGAPAPTRVQEEEQSGEEGRQQMAAGREPTLSLCWEGRCRLCLSISLSVSLPFCLSPCLCLSDPLSLSLSLSLPLFFCLSISL